MALVIGNRKVLLSAPYKFRRQDLARGGLDILRALWAEADFASDCKTCGSPLALERGPK
jgi:hypothetical protein